MTDSEYRSPRPVNPDDGVARFDSRSDEQTSWLRHHALQSSAAGSTRVFVVTTTRSAEVVAYYAWRMAQIGIADSPSRLKRGAGRYPQPVALLARLAMDVQHEGHGLGAAMLADAIRRLVTLDPQIGCRGLLVHAESEAARSFYLRLIPELTPSPTDPMHLILLMKDARKTLLGS